VTDDVKVTCQPFLHTYSESFGPQSRQHPRQGNLGNVIEMPGVDRTLTVEKDKAGLYAPHRLFLVQMSIDV
jgi:hypothetical protein